MSSNGNTGEGKILSSVKLFSRVAHPFRPPAKKRNIEIKIVPCNTPNCTCCEKADSSRSAGLASVGANGSKHPVETVSINSLKQAPVPTTVSSFKRVKNEPCNNSEANPNQKSGSASSNEIIYSVLWGKTSSRKHKKWEEDGFLIINGKDLTLKSTNGKIIGTSQNYKLPDELESGVILRVGGKEVQLEDLVDKAAEQNDEPEKGAVKVVPHKLATKLVTKPFINPCAPGTHLPVDRGNRDVAKPLFNPSLPGAFVLPEPEWDHQRLFNPGEIPIVPVVVDPHISRHLRPHQRHGIEFLYRSVYLPPAYVGGAILADDMGLGKTLQCIAILWTFHKQGPYGRKEISKRSLIVTPSSLVHNWEKEFLRWLGTERIRVYAVTSDRPLDKCPGNIPVIIISYDMAIRSENSLKLKKFDLMICDEAHKIKNMKNQAYQLLKSLSCPRRILLTGTPVQNDLMELYSLVDFVRPGALGTEYEFKKEYAIPIAKYQDDSSSGMQKNIGMMQAGRLNSEISSFFLRRDASVMLKYLPGRITQIVFCNPSALQIKLYRAVMNSSFAMSVLNESCQSPLAVILLLKKLCNHPHLVHPKNQSECRSVDIYDELLNVFPTTKNHKVILAEDSGKLMVLMHMLRQFHSDEQKVVLVSHYTKTLSVLEEVCKSRGFSIIRLDGSTVAKERIAIVDRFNSSSEPLIFLLSSKAGGVGLNLQSASKIILYDIDWNPAHDVQAMARCWRLGQKKETHIYRLLTCGTIEERIYQRQISKQDVSGSVVDLLLSNNIRFSPEELKDIFTLYETGCVTHELIGCECKRNGSNVLENMDINLDLENQPPMKKRKIEAMGELMQWEHFGQPLENSDLDPAVLHPSVDFIFRNKSTIEFSDEPDLEVEHN